MRRGYRQAKKSTAKYYRKLVGIWPAKTTLHQLSRGLIEAEGCGRKFPDGCIRCLKSIAVRLGVEPRAKIRSILADS